MKNLKLFVGQKYPKEIPVYTISLKSKSVRGSVCNLIFSYEIKMV